jgi:phage tail protein X
MPSSISKKILSDQVRRLTIEAEDLAQKAVSSKPFLKAVQQNTNASQATGLPPEPVLSMFRDKLADVSADFRKRNRGTSVTWIENYKMVGKQWTLKVAADVIIRTKIKGGSNYVIRKGDTLWDIAKATYGSGAYWPEIEYANKGLVKSGGKFIVAGVTIKLPKVVVPSPDAAPQVFAQSKERRACSPAMGIAIPDISITIKRTRFRKVIPTPTTTIVVTCEAEGSLTATNSDEMPLGFNLSKYEAELKSAVEGFATSISIDPNIIKSIGVSSNWGKIGSIATKWNSDDGSLSGELTSHFRGKRVGNASLTGSVTVRLTLKFLPNLRAQRISGKIQVVAYDIAEKAIYVLAGLVVVAVVVVAARVLAGATIIGGGLVAASLVIVTFPKAMKQIAN